MQLILSILEFQLPCYHASRMLKIPYTNSKVINRAYKVDKRVFTNPNRFQYMDLGFEVRQEELKDLRKEVFDLVLHSIKSGLFPERVVNKIMIVNPEILLKMTS